MRQTVASKVEKSAIRLCVAVLLASAAGCSSDASRFGGFFSRSDDITTNSIRTSNVPIPRGDIAGAVAEKDRGNARDLALDQQFPDPVRQSASYDPVSTGSTPVSRTRAASTPMDVQREAIASPTPSPRERPLRDRSLDQSFPEKQEAAIPQERMKPDPLTTGTTKRGWSTANAPSVVLRQGESVATLSKRFGVPEKEILKANKLKSSSDAQSGQRMLIPTYGIAENAAKASAADPALADTDKRKNIPSKPDSRDVAIVPGQAQSRDKSANRTDMVDGKKPATGEGPSEGTYTVKAGDSLNRIAKINNVPVDALREVNGLTTASIRVGQTLKLPAGRGKTDAMTTASVQTKKPEMRVAKADPQPAEYTPPVVKQTVTEAVAKGDIDDESPKGTGISKYRWPVRGAVVAAYGANVEGNRNDGINISVPEGTPIKAAENGVVIYSGSSLKELGNAVLVRHDDGTVTVYGNASELKVQRGQKIQRGQTLASSGMSGTASQPQVHFEVRKNATPVNPATFLE